MGTIPQIDNGKLPLTNLNVVHMLRLPSNTPYGNLLLKGMNIVRRIDRVNLEIQRVFDSYVHPREESTSDPRQDILEHQFYEEQVVYWLRKTADELISLAYVISEAMRTGSWPTVVRVDCVGALEAQGFDVLSGIFMPHRELLLLLNDVANAFKHSFINTDMTVVGSEYPVVYALALKRNKLSAQPKFYSIKFAELVYSFSNFYKDITTTIQNWSAAIEIKRA